MTKLDKLKLVRNILNEFIDKLEIRKYKENQEYEQKKARGQCVATNRCKMRPVPTRTMCSHHLRKSAEAANKWLRDKK